MSEKILSYEEFSALVLEALMKNGKTEKGKQFYKEGFQEEDSQDICRMEYSAYLKDPKDLRSCIIGADSSLVMWL